MTATENLSGKAVFVHKKIKQNGFCLLSSKQLSYILAELANNNLIHNECRALRKSTRTRAQFIQSNPTILAATNFSHSCSNDTLTFWLATCRIFNSYFPQWLLVSLVEFFNFYDYTYSWGIRRFYIIPNRK